MPTPVIFSWSAGKDSAFGLWSLQRDPEFEVCALLTTLTEGYGRVSMSGIREELLDSQARMLGLPLVKVWIPPDCPNSVYQSRMSSALATEPLLRVQHMAFADLYLEDVRAYREERLEAVGKVGVFPLWGRDTAALAREMISAGIRATLVCVDPRVLPASFAGRPFDEGLLDELPEDVDPCGERGEFHTFVWAAPMYSAPIPCRSGEVVTRDGFVFCDLVPGRAG
ncbi:MAG: ATP-binding protein [Candidatus Dormiibacterota bacterium]